VFLLILPVDTRVADLLGDLVRAPLVPGSSYLRKCRAHEEGSFYTEHPSRDLKSERGNSAAGPPPFALATGGDHSKLPRASADVEHGATSINQRRLKVSREEEEEEEEEAQIQENILVFRQYIYFDFYSGPCWVSVRDALLKFPLGFFSRLWSSPLLLCLFLALVSQNLNSEVCVPPPLPEV